MNYEVYVSEDLDLNKIRVSVWRGNERVEAKVFDKEALEGNEIFDWVEEAKAKHKEGA